MIDETETDDVWERSVISARYDIDLCDLRDATYAEIAAELRRRAGEHATQHNAATFGGDSYGSSSSPFHDPVKPKRLRALADLLERE